MAAGEFSQPWGLKGMRRPVAAVALGIGALLIGLVPFAHASEEARTWLKRMSEASKTLNYEGTFVYRQGAHIESVRIIHRADADGGKERLVSLNGVPREVLRDGTQVTCIMPDNHAVVVGSRRSKGRLAASFEAVDEALESYYSFSVGDSDRVAGRTTRIIRIEPRDEYRYGYELWLDEETGLLLKSALLDGKAKVLEQVLYTSMSMPDSIPDTMLEPETSGEGFTWYTSDGAKPDAQAIGSDWAVAGLPAGFALKSSEQEPIPSSDAPVQHMVYSDGLASFSVYIERLTADKEPFVGISQMGAMSAFGKVSGEYQLTVVGEVPSNTVEQVGRAVQRK